MRNKGVEMDREVRIYEICNPHQAKKVLEANPSISTALPCRVAVYAAGDGYRIATMLPTEMMKAFETPGIESVAAEVERAIRAMMNEAAA